MSVGQFTEWYKKQRELANGLCQWCKEPFTKNGKGIMTDHDLVTGEPRALLCGLCNLAEGLGVKRLRIVLNAVAAWETKKAFSATTQTSLDPIRASFPKWSAFINDQKPGRDGRVLKVISNLRQWADDDEVVNQLWDELRDYMDKSNV